MTDTIPLSVASTRWNSQEVQLLLGPQKKKGRAMRKNPAVLAENHPCDDTTSGRIAHLNQTMNMQQAGSKVKSKKQKKHQQTRLQPEATLQLPSLMNKDEVLGTAPCTPARLAPIKSTQAPQLLGNRLRSKKNVKGSATTVLAPAEATTAVHPKKSKRRSRSIK